MSESLLKDFMKDIADTDIITKVLIVRIGDQVSSNSYMIEDDSGKAELVFKEDAKKQRDRLEVGLIVKLFGITKIDAAKFEFNKHSFWVEEKQHTLNTNRKQLKLKDLCKLAHGDVVMDKLVVKVIEVKETAKTRYGTPYKKVSVADDEFSVRITIWRNDIPKFENKIELGSVYEFSNFTIDKYPLDSNGKSPKDINLRYSSSIRKLKVEEIPEYLTTVAVTKDEPSIEGMIKYITNIYDYLACPGNGGPCGKSIRDSKFCEKCGLNLGQADPIPSYKCDLVFFANTNVIYHITAFSSQLKPFEIDGSTTEEKLANIKNKLVYINMYEKGDDYILSKLNFE